MFMNNNNTGLLTDLMFYNTDISNAKTNTLQNCHTLK